jgi:ubiquinone/menaquinone biosynthesis C-methylase UbiE
VASERDKWAAWVLGRSFGDDPEQEQARLREIGVYRDRVLANARLRDGETLLDVGAGDGLIGFGALELVGASGKVIFSDVSLDLVEHCRSIAQDLGVEASCEFLQAPAEDLEGVADASVDALATRSVLIYVKDKARAFAEFRRVLRPGGRISLFEPINSYFPDEGNLFWNYDVTPVADLARSLDEDDAESAEHDPMMDFDDRDLVRLAKDAGFEAIHLDLEISVVPGAWATSWNALLHMSPNPLAPTVEETIRERLTEDEATRFEAHVKPLADAQQGVMKSAFAYLWASTRI